MPEPSANLELIRRLTANSSRAQLETMKNNMILGQSWDRILMSAPNAIAGMGSCYVAAAIPEASLIKLRGKTLEYEHVQPNLIQCADLGREAFMEAHTQMTRVQLSADYICKPLGLIDKLTRALQDDRLRAKLVPKLLDQLEQMAKRCMTGTNDTKIKFEHWAKQVRAVTAACGNSAAQNVVDQKENEADLIKVQGRQRFWEDRSKETGAAVEEAGSEVKTARQNVEKAFKSAKPRLMDRISDTLDRVGRIGENVIDRTFDVAEELARSLPNAYSPFPQPLSYPGPRNRDLWPQPQNQVQESFTQGPDVTLNLSSTLLPVEMVAEIVSFNGVLCSAGAVDFNNASPDSQAQLVGIVNGIEMHLARQVFSNPADGLVTEVNDSLTALIQCAKQIQTRADRPQDDSQKRGKNSQNDDENPPEYSTTDSAAQLDAQTKAWQEAFGNALKQYQGLARKVKDKKRGATNGAQVNPGGNSSARQRLELLRVRQEGQKMAMEQHRRAEDEHRRTKEILLEQSLRAKELEKKNIQLGEIKAILKDCLGALETMNKELLVLTEFFKELYEAVRHLAEDRVHSFKESANFVVELGEMTTEEDIGPLKEEVDSIRLYYALTYELAGMYKNMSQKHIMPGLALLSDLNIDGSSVEKKNAKIKRYTLEAQQATNKFARNFQDEMNRAFVDRRGEAEALMD